VAAWRDARWRIGIALAPSHVYRILRPHRYSRARAKRNGMAANVTCSMARHEKSFHACARAYHQSMLARISAKIIEAFVASNENDIKRWRHHGGVYISA